MSSENPHIDLAREADFALGGAEVRPALRAFIAGGAEETIEPRVMQVLIALSRRAGEVVSRDDLVEACWEGRVVGDDAIQRAVAKTRKLGEDSGAFAIETIARVGYRLLVDRGLPAGQENGADRRQDAGGPVLAVLAFDNLSPDPEMAFFANGVSEDILQLVARATSLKVIARASSFQFTGTDKAIRNVADQLGATHVLDGSVRRGGDRVRINAQLIEAETQTTLWSQQYDRSARDLFTLQDEIAGAVAASLQTRFAPVRGAEMDGDTHDLFLRVREAIELDPHGVATLHLVDQLNAAAPDFALGWVMGAGVRMNIRLGEADDDAARALYEAARACADRAMTLEPTSPQSNFAADLVEPVCGRLTERIERLRAAAEAAPYFTYAATEVGRLLARAGRIEEALPFCRGAYERNPLYPGPANTYAVILYCLGRTDEALTLLESTCRRWPGSYFPWTNLVMFACQTQRWELVDQWATPERRAPFAHMQRAMRETDWLIDAYRAPSPMHGAMVMAGLRRSLERNGRIRLAPFTLGANFCAIDELYDLADQASFAHLFEPGGRLEVGDDPVDFTALMAPNAINLQRNPRFVMLCARLGLVEHWIETDRWPDCARRVRYDFRAEARAAFEALQG